MRRLVWGVVVLAAAIGVVAAGTRTEARRYAEGAPPGFSGGFGEDSCHACHFEGDVNSEGGRVTLNGVPSQFVAGERYPLTIALTRSGMKLGGFQLTARFKEGGAQAGTLVADPKGEQRVGIEVQQGIQYAGQKKEGAMVSADDTIEWTIVWTAPQSTDPVVFNVAANAANGDGTANGDYVHTTEVETASKSPPD